MIPSENISALTQNSFCRCLKHASPVADMEGKVAEKYVYDPAGNILSKTVNGKTTTYTYDKANQVVSSVCNLDSRKHITIQSIDRNIFT